MTNLLDRFSCKCVTSHHRTSLPQQLNQVISTHNWPKLMARTQWHSEWTDSCSDLGSIGICQLYSFLMPWNCVKKCRRTYKNRTRWYWGGMRSSSRDGRKYCASLRLDLTCSLFHPCLSYGSGSSQSELKSFCFSSCFSGRITVALADCELPTNLPFLYVSLLSLVSSKAVRKKLLNLSNNLWVVWQR